jgi:hypothetical protein
MSQKEFQRNFLIFRLTIFGGTREHFHPDLFDREFWADAHHLTMKYLTVQHATIVCVHEYKRVIYAAKHLLQPKLNFT